MIIGLTGPSGSGKSTICEVAEELGYCVINADKVGHSIIKKGKDAYTEIVGAFGEGILLPSGEIDRKVLGGIVFSDTDKLAMLNNITHKRISEAIEKQIALCDNKVTVLEAAVLFESGMNKICDYVIAVTAPFEERIRRICERDGITAEKAALRLRSQQNDEFYSSRANKAICNNGDVSSLKSVVRAVFEEVCNGKI